MPSVPGAGRLRWTLTLVITAALAIPTAAAWTLDPSPMDERPAPRFAAWTTDLTPSAFPGDAGAAALSAVGCALGDVSGDGVADLLVLVSDPTAAVQKVQALAGPDFTTVVWEKVSTLGQILQCAPDLDLDGTLDPILRTVGDAAGTAAAGATDEARHQVQQVLSGASGVAMLGRTATDTVTGAATPVGGAAAGAAQQATSTLLPAATGAAAFLQTEITQGGLPIPGGLPLPVDALTTTVTSAAQLQVLDAAGAVVATISIDQAGVEPLVMAPLALTGGLPDVAVLTRTLGPVDQVATGVPELALYAADGTLSWATQLPASTGLPILLPQAGDLDLDGVGDLVVSTVQTGVETAPAAAFTVLSGVDGSVLFDSGEAVTGLMAALPLGELPDGAALLRVVSPDGASKIALSALDGAGKVLWTVDVDALAEPVNGVLDAHTGDLTGFTDLTGDAIPDVAVAVQSSAGVALQAIDGLTGEVAWTATIPGADAVVPVLVGATSAAGGLAGPAEGAVGQVASGDLAGLLALGTTATEATLTLVDPLTGAVEWVATAAVPSGAGLASLSAQMAGDLDGDGSQDLLITADYNQTGSGSASRNRDTGATGAADSDGSAPGSVTAVSGDSGQTLYAASAEPQGSTLTFDSGASPSGSAAGEGDDGKATPGPAPLLLAFALVVATALRRRRD